MALEQMRETLAASAGNFLARQASRLGNAAELVAGRSPERILRLGFAIVRTDGKAVFSAAQVGKGDTLDIEVAAGRIAGTGTSSASTGVYLWHSTQNAIRKGVFSFMARVISFRCGAPGKPMTGDGNSFRPIRPSPPKRPTGYAGGGSAPTNRPSPAACCGSP